MKRQVWKYKLIERMQIVNMPKDAEILTVQVQQGVLCLWALVDPDAEEEKRFIEIYETGEDIGYDMGVSRSYIGTYEMYGDDPVREIFMGHVFEHTGV